MSRASKLPWVCVPKMASGGHFSRPEWAQHLMGKEMPGSRYHYTICGRLVPRRGIEWNTSLVQAPGSKCRKCASIWSLRYPDTNADGASS